MSNSLDIAQISSVAKSAARDAGKLARLRWDRPLTLSQKGFRDIVTDADFAVQSEIVDGIRGRFPEHGFLTEEADTSLRQSGPIIWIIDPIDGTTNYSRRQPVFCISIAAVATQGEGAESGRPLVGVVYDPMRDELFDAVAGGGSRLNGQTLRASKHDDLGDWVVGLDWSHAAEKRQAAVEALSRFAHRVNTIRAIGSSALALAWVAAGRLDAYMNFSLKPWDVAAASLLIEEAGGVFGDMDNAPWRWPADVAGCVASNGRNHQAFLGLVNPALDVE